MCKSKRDKNVMHVSCKVNENKTETQNKWHVWRSATYPFIESTLSIS